MSKKDYPLVSVIIPAYNMEKTIGKSLDSVINQTYQNIEIIVIDDGSEDQTQTIVSQFIEQDKRIKLLQQKNSGVAAARNKGIEMAKGELIAPLDADDIWYPENLAKQVECIVLGGKDVGLVYSWSVDIDENDVPIGTFRAANIEGQVYATLVCHNFLGNASCSLMRRNVLQELGGYNQELKQQDAQGCEDWDLYLKIARNYDFKVVPDFLVGYRKLAESMSGNYETMARSQEFLLANVRQNNPEISEFICRLSKSNLYMYFAHQSYYSQDYETTLSWLKKAIEAEFITPFIRPGFYRLFIFSWLQKLLKNQLKVSDKKVISYLTIKEIYDQKLKLKLMLSIGNVFHQCVKRFTQRKKIYQPVVR